MTPLLQSAAALAPAFGLSPRQMAHLCHSGYLRARKTGQMWLVLESRESLAEKMARRRRVGAPRKNGGNPPAE
jgi:hypothetical protein